MWSCVWSGLGRPGAWCKVPGAGRNLAWAQLGSSRLVAERPGSWIVAKAWCGPGAGEAGEAGDTGAVHLDCLSPFLRIISGAVCWSGAGEVGEVGGTHNLECLFLQVIGLFPKIVCPCRTLAGCGGMINT